MFYFAPAFTITRKRKAFAANDTSAKENGVGSKRALASYKSLVDHASPD